MSELMAKVAVIAPSEVVSFIKCDCNSQISFIKRDDWSLITFIKCDNMLYKQLGM